jgi:hypothetical protein
MSAALDEGLVALADIVENRNDGVDLDRAALALSLIQASARTYPTKAMADVAVKIIEGDRAAALTTALLAAGTFAAIELEAGDLLDEMEAKP